MSAKLDIIVVGATGYTGRITCKYLQSLPSIAGRWGIAARNAEKMEEVKKSLGLSVPSFVVDFAKPETLDAVCLRATCVLSCAGPFIKVGMPVVEACVRNRTHYVDSTGEFTFVRLVSERFHDAARAKGVTLLSCCGFDCMPSDLGNYVVHRAAGDEEVAEVKAYIAFQSAGISNGTANTMGAMFETMTPADKSPCSLVTAGLPQPRRAPSRMLMSYDFSAGRIVAPWLMGHGNERLVRRTNALMGSRAVYSEALVGGFWKCLASTLSIYVMGVVFSIAPLRRYLLQRFYPAEATAGPPDHAKSGNFYKATFVGTTVSGKRIEAVVSDNREMYEWTGIFLGQCALSVVALAQKKALKPGVLTACSALGDDIVERCRAAGVHIDTKVGPEKKQV